MSNDWIKFLKNYGPIPASDNMYDETIQSKQIEFNVSPISIDLPILDEMIAKVKNGEGHLILTGTAGDGKTYSCRKIWSSIAGSDNEWDSSKKYMLLNLGDRTLVVIKDLSEMTYAEQSQWLTRFSESLYQQGNEQFVIAANDGQLIEALQRLENSTGSGQLKTDVENLLLERSDDNPQLSLYNLSRQKTRDLMSLVLDEVLENDAWTACNNCEYQKETTERNRCPIWESRERLRGAEEHLNFRSRLLDLIQLSDANDMHLPIRQLFILVTNILLGKKTSPENLMSCAAAKRTATQKTTEHASPYSNVFGFNLPSKKRQQYTVFRTLANFRIGEETANSFDNLLVYGKSDESLLPDYEAMLRNDVYFGVSQEFESNRERYVEGRTEPSSLKEFLSSLIRQRQRLFFILQDDQDNYPIWKLSCYNHAGRYLHLTSSIGDEHAVQTYLEELIIGLNRVFSGMMGTEGQKLHLCETGVGLSSRINRVHRLEVPANGRWIGVSILNELSSNGRPVFQFKLGPDSEVKPIKFELALIHFEYLQRIKLGGLPASFSHQCFEDFLSLKAILLTQLNFIEMDDSSKNSISLLETSGDGTFNVKKVSVKTV